MKVRARMVFRDSKPPSRLENRFELLWQALGGPVLEKEFRFHPVRKWRADFAHLASRMLIEIEGGIYVHGRVVRLGPNELTAESIGRLTCLLRQSSASEEKASVGCPDRE